MGFSNVSFSSGSLFEGVPEGLSFGAIIFNAPNISGRPSRLAEAAYVREDQVLVDFYQQFPQHIQDGGYLIMPGSSRFEHDLTPLAMAKSQNWTHRIIARDRNDEGHSNYVVVIGNPKSIGTRSSRARR